MLSKVILALCLACGVLSKVVHYDWSIDWVTASPDGYTRPVVGINGQWPCPQIDLDKGDRLIVQVYNNLGNESTSIHWHGLGQYGTNHMDGTTGTTQCPVPPGSNFTYDFQVDQSGSYWYHSHTQGQYPDGLRGPLIVHDPNPGYHFDEEITFTMSDWYHPQMPGLLNLYESNASVYNNPIESGQAPIPDSGLINESSNSSIFLKPGKTYLIHMLHIGNFAGVAIYFDDHEFTTVGVDGVATHPMPLGEKNLRIAPAQRWDVLVTTKNDTSKNFAIFGILDLNMLFPPQGIPPPGYNPNMTAYLVYDKEKPLPPPVVLHEFNFFDDVALKPADDGEILQPVNQRIVLDMQDANITGTPRFNINNITYLAQRVPSLYTALTTGEYNTNPAVYGKNTIPFILKYNEVVELVVNNLHANLHPMHLHGHQFQVLERSFPDMGSFPGTYMANVSSTPLRRDTIMLNKKGWAVLRFRADNPGVWLFHCHIEWHVQSGLMMTMVEAPEMLRRRHVPQQHLDACQKYGMKTKGNAAGNVDNPLDLTGQITLANTADYTNVRGSLYPPTEGPTSRRARRSILGTSPARRGLLTRPAYPVPVY